MEPESPSDPANVFARMGQSAHFGYIRITQARPRGTLAATKPPVLHHILIVGLPRIPAEITNSVVEGIAVVVAALHTARTGPKKRRSNEAMHPEFLLASFDPQIHMGVPQRPASNRDPDLKPASSPDTWSSARSPVPELGPPRAVGADEFTRMSRDRRKHDERPRPVVTVRHQGFAGPDLHVIIADADGRDRMMRSHDVPCSYKVRRGESGRAGSHDPRSARINYRSVD